MQYICGKQSTRERQGIKWSTIFLCISEFILHLVLDVLLSENSLLHHPARSCFSHHKLHPPSPPHKRHLCLLHVFLCALLSLQELATGTVE